MKREATQPGNVQLPAAHPIALEWPLESDPGVIRAVHWPGNKPSVLLIHDIGESFDLDSWGELPNILSQVGYAVFALDLPGHGLSEVAFSDPIGSETLRLACQKTLELTGHSTAIVVAGSALRLINAELLATNAISSLVVFSPPAEMAAPGIVPKLAFVGATDKRARAAGDRFLRKSRGWTLVSSFGTTAQGHGLLETPHAWKIIDQLLSFLRDHSVSSIGVNQ